MAQRETVTTSTLRRVFRGVKRACYAGLGSTALRQEVGRRAAAVVPSDAYALAAVDPDLGLLTDVVAQGLPETMSTEFLYQVYPEGEAERFQHLARSGKVLATLNARRGSDSDPDADSYYSAGYRELLRRHRLERELRGALCCDGEMWGTWCIMRERSSPRFCSREQRFIRRLAGVLGRPPCWTSPAPKAPARSTPTRSPGRGWWCWMVEGASTW